MGIHWGRLALVLAIVAGLLGTSGGVYYFFFRESQQARSLMGSAEERIAQGDFQGAEIEVEKLLKLEPQSAQAHYLKAIALLAGRPLHELGPTDPTGLAAVRALLQTVQRAPDHTDAHALLVTYFLSISDPNEAAVHGRRVMEKDPKNIEAAYAVALSLIPDRSNEALPLIDMLLADERPPRPRTIWLASQIADAVPERADLAELTKQWIKGNPTVSTTDISDRLALVELRTWQSRQSNDPVVIEEQIHAAMEELIAISTQMASQKISPRLILRTSTRLLPPKTQRTSNLSATYAKLEGEVDELVDQLFKRAAESQVLDPMLYIGQASRLRARGDAGEAVEILKQAISAADKAGGESRQMFAVCDLWLAEHYLDEGKSDLAEPHIQVLMAASQLRPMGEMLTGYRLMQQGDYDTAARHLAAAIAKLGDHGAAHALIGLCQLRRGLISEGRQHLEKGIRLGAQSPRYKAWLALALAEGGYHEQALALAREILESQEYGAIGRALVGQLRLQSGDFDQAASDLQAAYEAADGAFRPSIRLAQAELALNQEKPEQALPLIEELKGTSLAAQAFALEYRHLRKVKQQDKAESVLKEGRSRFPDSTLLLAIEIQRHLELERFEEAQKILADARAKQPTAVAPILLLAEVYEQAGQMDKSVELLRQSSASMPQEVSLRIRLVEKLLSERQFEEAGKHLEEMKKDENINSTTVDYLYARSAALRGDMASAQQFIERAAAKDPDNPTLKFLMGQLAAQRGDYSTASAMFEQSLAGGSHRQQAVQALFESLLRLGDTTRAVEVLGKAEKRGHRVRTLRGQLLRLLARQEDWRVLEKEVEAMLSSDPTEDDYLLVISAFRYVHQPKMAASYVQKALAGFPNSPSLREQEASLLLELGDYPNAEQKLATLLTEQPTNAMFHVLRIYLLEQTERMDDARAAVEEAWQKCPGHPAIAALQVLSLLRDGNVEKAMEFAERAKRDYPKLPDPRYLVARMHESLGNHEKAMGLLNVLVAEDPKNERAAEHYFRLLVSTGLPHEVQPAIEKLVSAHPNNDLLMGALAEYQALQGDLAGAQSTIEKLQSNPSAKVMSDYAKAVLAFARRDFKEAERLARVVMADPRGHVPSTFLLSRLRAADGKYAEAIDLVGRVCRQQPDNTTAHLFHARLRGEIGEWDKAEVACREFLEREPTDRSMRLLLARSLLARGGDARAKEASQIAWKVFQEAVRGPEELEAIMNVLFASGESPKCRQIIADLEANASSPENLLAAGRSSFIASDYATASRLADAVLAKRPDDLGALLLAADTQTRVAVASEDASHFEKAVEYYERILKKDPANTAAANNLAWTLGVSLGKEHRALEALLRHIPSAREPSPTLPVDLLDTVGTLYLRMNRLDEAREYFEAVVARDPNNAMASFRLGQVYQKQGREDRANQHFARARELSPTENWDARKLEAGLGN